MTTARELRRRRGDQRRLERLVTHLQALEDWYKLTRDGDMMRLMRLERQRMMRQLGLDREPDGP